MESCWDGFVKMMSFHVCFTIISEMFHYLEDWTQIFSEIVFTGFFTNERLHELYNILVSESLHKLLMYELNSFERGGWRMNFLNIGSLYKFQRNKSNKNSAAFDFYYSSII